MNEHPPMGLADLHIHTAQSDGLAQVPEVLEYVEHNTELDVIAVTDHDNIQGGFLARELAAKHNYGFDVIVGAEITTLDGHLLALFLEEPVPSFRSLAKTIEAVRAQGGICVVPHPLSWLTPSVGKGKLDKITQGTFPDISLDALETSNSSFAGRITRKRVRRLNDQIYQLAETGGSDAHMVEMIGSSLTLFSGRTAEDLRRSLLAKGTSSLVVPGRNMLPGRHMTIALLPWKLLRVLLKGLFVYPPKLAYRSVRKVLEVSRKL